MKYEIVVKELFSKAGITVNGDQPYDIQIHDPRTYKRILAESNLGLGESYMDGWWDCQHIDQFTEKMFLADIINIKPSLNQIIAFLMAKVTNRQSVARASDVCENHYDLGNDLFIKMLDPRMVYTCGYWKNAKNLEEAQIAKMDLICQKLELKSGMKLLDIGCGWGSFMKYASKKYGVECTGYTLSKNQIELGEQLCQGLPITFIFEDYRKIVGQFDRIVSIGMFEAVGYKNFRTFMKVVAKALKKDGHILLHTMGANRSWYASEPWYDKYIFPNGLLPSLSQISKATEHILVVEDLQNIGPDYDKTLLAWNDNFQNSWSELEKNYSPRFKRMWEFYLLQVAGVFRARNQQLWQIILTHPGTKQLDYRK